MRVGFLPSSESPAAPLFQVSPILGRVPLVVERVPQEAFGNWEAKDQTHDFEVLLVPCSDADDATRLESLRSWVEGTSGTATLVAFRNAAVLWSTDRVVILSEREQIESVGGAVVEFTQIEHELRRIELALEDSWATLHGDASHAFAFREKALSQRSELERRFCEHLERRANLERLVSRIQALPVHPPTLRSQMSERLRERTRMEDRWERQKQQLEVFERVYDLIAQRSSDFSLARSGHFLEWLIVVMLAVQIVLWIVDLLSATTGT